MRLMGLRCKILSLGLMLGTGSVALAQTAFIINGKSVGVDQLYKENQGKFYDLEKEKYETIESLARDAYLDAFWADLAKKKGKSVEAARKEYLDQNANVSSAEIKETLNQLKDHPNVKKLSDDEKERQITDYLVSRKTSQVVNEIIDKGMAAGKLKVVYKRPEEPIFNISVNANDHVKYGPKSSDTSPAKGGCKGDDCAVTVVEYSEYQCPFCVRVLPAVNRLLTEYRGDVRWIVRDFPLGFHNRAKPAAVAAKCAADQGKFWEMYQKLFDNQSNLGDDHLKKYGKEIGLDQNKYIKCLDNPQQKLALIEENYKSGEQLGVTGTPAFFINGRRLSGALPYEKFKEIFDEELAKKGKGQKNKIQ